MSIESAINAEEANATATQNAIPNVYDSNLNFQLTRARILTKLLTEEDKKLIANLIDQSKKVILHLDDLKALIAAMKDITPDRVNISVCETILTSCCKARVLPFKSITSINITDSEFTPADKITLTCIYHISLNTVYDEPFVKLNQ